MEREHLPHIEKRDVNVLYGCGQRTPHAPHTSHTLPRLHARAGECPSPVKRPSGVATGRANPSRIEKHRTNVGKPAAVNEGCVRESCGRPSLCLSVASLSWNLAGVPLGRAESGSRPVVRCPPMRCAHSGKSEETSR